jgi:hypothetical protein
MPSTVSIKRSNELHWRDSSFSLARLEKVVVYCLFVFSRASHCRLSSCCKISLGFSLPDISSLFFFASELCFRSACTVTSVLLFLLVVAPLDHQVPSSPFGIPMPLHCRSSISTLPPAASCKNKKNWDSYFIHAPILSPSSPFGKTRQRL